MPMDLSNPHQFNNTNFHFHGSHSDPGGISDNVMRSMVPGETYSIGTTRTITAVLTSRWQAAWSA